MKKNLVALCGLMSILMLLFGCDTDDSAELTESDKSRIGTVESQVTRDTAPLIDDERFTPLIADQRTFTFSLLQQLGEHEDGNLFVSPYSISAALAMVYAGAQGETRRQMAGTLNFPLDNDALHPGFNRLDRELGERASDEAANNGDPFRLDVVNQTWGHEAFEFRQDYLDLLARHYGAGIRRVDFRNDAEAVRLEINDWVERKTEERIVDLLPPESLNAETRFVLVNAIYFLGSWKHAFEEESTRNQPFMRPDGSQIDVPMMRQTAHFGHYAGEHTVAVSMPYIGDDIELVAMMPADADNFNRWAAELDREHFDGVLENINSRDVALHFPRFESGSDLKLSELLESMGMVDAFDECAADFSGITGADPCIPDRAIYIDEIFHKSFVDIDESGTEAAAATAVAMVRVTSLGPEPPTVRFDRPFYYFIHDRPTGLILFAGRMLDPLQDD
ncbi:serpin family protein [Marinimicrobium alkaliphilum]|uniref:serpin family protein n=1 Tax=Marinimicrobium alkaliphilum TaxID=2202654 RepID=UPI0013005A69|nr:serpin family protein [Marinimicrobium alkaliphilum]